MTLTAAATRARLRGIAQDATPGPWCADDYITRPGYTPNAWHVYELGEDDPPLASLSWLEPEANARHIAAFDPTTAIALLDAADALEAAEKERDDARARYYNAETLRQVQASHNYALTSKLEKAKAALRNLRDYASSVWFDEATATDEERVLMQESRIALAELESTP